MTQSLPGARDLDLGANGARTRWMSRVQNTVATAGAKVIPWIPTAVRRGLVRSRSVIIDGNTLDPTLQLMLSGQRAVGIDGLVVDDDPAASRAQLRETTLNFPGPQIHVEVDDVALPGPAGEIAARIGGAGEIGLSGRGLMEAVRNRKLDSLDADVFEPDQFALP